MTGGVCRMLVLQTIRVNQLHEFQAVCDRVREVDPGCAIAVLVTPETQAAVGALGCTQELLLSAGGERVSLLRRVRAARFDRVCIVSDSAGAPGQMRSDVLALAARPRELLWCAPGGDLRRVSRVRLVVRLLGEGVLAILALCAGAAVGAAAAAALGITSAAGCFRRART
jgi:hypothetical protein